MKTKLSKHQKKILVRAFANVQQGDDRGRRYQVVISAGEWEKLFVFCTWASLADPEQRETYTKPAHDSFISRELVLTQLGMFPTSDFTLTAGGDVVLTKTGPELWGKVVYEILVKQYHGQRKKEKAELVETFWRGIQSALGYRYSERNTRELQRRGASHIVNRLRGMCGGDKYIVVGNFREQWRAVDLSRRLKNQTHEKFETSGCVIEPPEPDVSFQEALDLLNCKKDSLSRSVARLKERRLVETHSLRRGLVLTGDGYELASNLARGDTAKRRVRRRKQPTPGPTVHTVRLKTNS